MESEVIGRETKRALRWGIPPQRLFVVCLLLLACSGTYLQGQQDERAVRAAYVYNLTKYVTWPRSDKDLLIGVIGDGSMDQALKGVIDGKHSDQRTIRVLLHPSDAELAHCDIVYVSGPVTAHTHALFDRLHYNPTLTVGDSGRFVLDGGMVGLIRAGDQIELQVNQDAASTAGLRISSRLLNLAVIVRVGKRG